MEAISSSYRIASLILSSFHEKIPLVCRVRAQHGRISPPRLRVSDEESVGSNRDGCFWRWSQWAEACRQWPKPDWAVAGKWVASIVTGVCPNLHLGMLRKSTTRSVYPKVVPRSVIITWLLPASMTFWTANCMAAGRNCPFWRSRSFRVWLRRPADRSDGRERQEFVWHPHIRQPSRLLVCFRGCRWLLGYGRSRPLSLESWVPFRRRDASERIEAWAVGFCGKSLWRRKRICSLFRRVPLFSAWSRGFHLFSFDDARSC